FDRTCAVVGAFLFHTFPSQPHAREPHRLALVHCIAGGFRNRRRIGSGGAAASDDARERRVRHPRRSRGARNHSAAPQRRGAAVNTDKKQFGRRLTPMKADKTNATFLFSIGVYLRSSVASYVLAFFSILLGAILFSACGT